MSKARNIANNGGRGTTANRPTNPTVGDTYFDTTVGSLVTYTSNGWLIIGAIPTTPTSISASDSGAGRNYNNGSALISFTPGPVFGTSYTVTSSPGSYTATGSSSPVTITGLQSSTQYTYSVVSTNVYGSSNASTSSSGVTATTVPQAPTIGSPSAGNEQVSVPFTPGATGGSAITGYTVTSSPGSISQNGSSSPIVVSGLTNGTDYTFTVTATNNNGTSIASNQSSTVTPIAGLPVSGATGWFLASDLPSTITDGITWTNKGSGLGASLVSSGTSSATTTSWQGGTALAGTVYFSCTTSSAQQNGAFTMFMAQQWTSGVFGPSVTMSGCYMLYSPGNPGYYGDGLYLFGHDQTNPAVVSHYRDNGNAAGNHYQRVNGNTYTCYESDRPGASGTFSINSSNANQRIAEVVIFNRELSGTEIATMETYLRNKYSI